MNNKNYNYDEDRNTRTRDIFYAVVSITTLIVAIIGASFAYFIASASSEERAVETGSTSFELGYDDTFDKLINTDLVPADKEVALYAALNQPDGTIPEGKEEPNPRCKDDNGQSVCSIYTFKVTNPANSGTNQRIHVSMNVPVNTFENLQLTVVNPNNGNQVMEEIHLDPLQITDFELEGLTTDLPAGEEVTYQMILWVKNIDEDQTQADANKSFAGTITVYPESGSGQIKGVIAAASGGSEGA